MELYALAGTAIERHKRIMGNFIPTIPKGKRTAKRCVRNVC